MSSNSFWQALVLSLRHPTTIAAFASVGLHATIGVALPTLPLFSTGGGGSTLLRPRNVQLIELTPAEFARLPQLYTTPEPEYSFDLPNAPESELGLPSFTTGAIPRNRDRSPQRPRESRPNLPPRPDGATAAPSGANRSLFNFAARDRTIRQRNRNPRNIPAPPSRNIPTFSEPASPNHGLSREEQLRRGLFAVENNENARLPPGDLNSLAEAGRESARVENLTPNLPQPPSLEPPLSPQELAARQRDNATADRIAQLREDYRHNPKNTTPEAERENERLWLEETNQTQARAQSRSITIQGAYPKGACVNRAQGTAIYRVIVQPNGRKTDMRQIRSTGYRILDRAAIAQVSGAGFARESAPISYRITIPFTYNANICPTLATPVTPRRSPTPSPAPAVSPSPTPTVSPSPTPAVSPSPTPTVSPSPTPTVSPPSEPSEVPPESPSLTPTEPPKQKPKEISPNNAQPDN